MKLQPGPEGNECRDSKKHEWESGEGFQSEFLRCTQCGTFGRRRSSVSLGVEVLRRRFYIDSQGVILRTCEKLVQGKRCHKPAKGKDELRHGRRGKSWRCGDHRAGSHDRSQ